MLAWGIAATVYLALVCQGAFLRQKIRTLKARQAQTDVSLAETTQSLTTQKALTARQAEENQLLQKSLEETATALAVQKTLTARQAEENQALLASLAEKESALAELSALKPKLYLPTEEDPQPEAPQEPIVYYNENTGIYHADRFCAPYQAIETPISQIPPRARPCKKCAEGVLPTVSIPASQPREEENQLSLF